jgi:hypothetical protein
MQFGQAFSYVFQDPDWIKKIGIGALISLIPIVGQIVVMGWMIEIIQRVIQNDPTPMPNWDDFGGKLIRGLKAWVVSLVYSIPIIILVIPISIISALATNSNGSSQQTMGIIAMLISICAGLLIFVYSILMMLVMPASLAKLAITDNIGAALKFGEIISTVRSNISVWLMVLVGAICVGFIAPLGSILCVIGALLTAVYGQAIMGHLVGQAYTQSSPTV